METPRRVQDSAELELNLRCKRSSYHRRFMRLWRRQTSDSDHAPQQITISLEPTGDGELDKRRIRAVYGTLIAFHGRDHFSFQIYEGGKPHLLDFPGVSTRICPALLDRLKKVVGAENWRIEEIAYL